MAVPKIDPRSPGQRAQDDQIAAEPALPPIQLPTDAVASPVETHLNRQPRHPVAIVGIVENGLVRPLDPTVKLPENAQVIIVTSEEV